MPDVLSALAGSKGPMENPAKHLVYRPNAMQLLSILTTTVEVMPKVSCPMQRRLCML